MDKSFQELNHIILSHFIKNGRKAKGSVDFKNYIRLIGEGISPDFFQKSSTENSLSLFNEMVFTDNFPGLSAEGILLKGRQEGLWISRSEKGYFLHGKQNGPFLMFDENGRLVEKGFYSNDVPVGTWTEWYEDGTSSTENLDRV